MIVAITTPAMGHLKPMLPLLSGLVTEGQRVVCFGHNVFEATIRETGAEFRPYPEVAYNIDAPDFNLVRMGADLMRASEVIHPVLLPQISALAPRLILQDFMALWGSRTGTALGIPRIHTIPTLVFNQETERRMRQEDGASKLAMDIIRGTPALIGAVMETRSAVSIREAYGLDRSWNRLAPPVQELVFCLESLQVGKTQGAVPRFYIGPTVDNCRQFDPAPYSAGYALVTFGTLSNTQTGRFEAAIRGAFLAGFSVVAQCGSKVDINYLRDVVRELEAEHPGLWGRVIESVKDMESLVLGAAVVIHHAGMATTWETARFHKPALFIPTNSDQKVLASQLEDLGVGLRLKKGSEFDAMAIAQALAGVQALACPWVKVDMLITKAGGAPRGIQLVLDVLEAVS